MKLLLFLLSFTLLLNSCWEECPDTTAHMFTQTDLDWFDFEVGDTVLYKDSMTNQTFFMVCNSKVIRIDSSYHADEHCSNEGSYHVRQLMNLVFNSDFPFFENDHLKLYMGVGTKEEHKTVVFLDFRNYETYLYYELPFEFDNQSVSISTLENTSPVFYEGTLQINDIEYSDVYSLCYSMDGTIHTNAYYDTLYYNKQGFLKFISSQYGHRLEILE
jgi:hypothetical protein